MANEPQIEFQGFVGKIVDFQNGSSIVNVSVTPSYRDKNSQQWVDKPTIWFTVNPLSDQARNEINEIRSLKGQNMSVRVLVNGSLSKRVSEKNGQSYENLEVAARLLRIMSSKPKQQQNGQQSQYAGGGYAAQPAQGYGQQSPSDPWNGGQGDGFNEPDF